MEETVQKSHEQWKNAKRILIVANSNSNKDVLFASLALLDIALTESKSAYLLSPVLAKTKLWVDKLRARIDYNHIKTQIPQELSIVLPSNLMELEGVSYIKRPDGNFEILLDGKAINESAAPAPEITKSQGTFDLIVIIGAPTNKLLLENGFNLEKLKEQAILFLTNAKTLNGNESKTAIMLNGSDKSFSGKVLDMFHIDNNKLNSKQLTLILSGLLSFTKLFTKNISPQLFNKLAVILESSVDYYEALSLAQQDLTLNKIHLIGELLKSIELVQPGLYAGYLSKVQHKKMKLDLKDIFKAAEIHDAEIVLLYFESENGMDSKVYLKGINHNLILRRLLKTYKGKGSDHDGMFLTSYTYPELMAEIRSKFGNNSQETSEDVRNTPKQTKPNNPLDAAKSAPKPLQIKELLKKGR